MSETNPLGQQTPREQQARQIIETHPCQFTTSMRILDNHSQNRSFASIHLHIPAEEAGQEQKKGIRLHRHGAGDSMTPFYFTWGKS